MTNIMFVCTENICRSAMAHKMLEKRIKEMGKETEVYSCGVFAEEGDKSTIEAIEVMEEYGIDLKPHRATNIKKSGIENMDIILCATTSHKNNITIMYPHLKEKIYTIKEYAGYKEDDLDIKDPWGYNIEVYRKCREEINKCLDIIIQKI